jgi:hypothetical protein
MPVKGPVLGVAVGATDVGARDAVGAAGSLFCESFTPATTATAISTATPSTAPIRRRRRFAAGGTGGGPLKCAGTVGDSPLDSHGWANAGSAGVLVGSVMACRAAAAICTVLW